LTAQKATSVVEETEVSTAMIDLDQEEEDAAVAPQADKVKQVICFSPSIISLVVRLPRAVQF
jgi:hypothetical protein